MTTSLSTLAALQLRQTAVLRKLRKIEDEIVADYQQLVAPAKPSSNKVETFVQSASRAWFVVDGVLTGYKLMRRFGGISRMFSSKKRR